MAIISGSFSYLCGTMVPVSSIISMAVGALVGFAAPVALVWWLVKKHNARIENVLFGAGVFFLFALILEPIVHQIVLNGPAGSGIIGNTWKYALYGGSMAALFEESGRFLAMKFLMKKEPSSAIPGVAYGLGHGGMEMLMLFGVGMISNMVIAIMMNAGQMDALLANVPVDTLEQAQAQLSGIEDITAGTLAIGFWERCSALLLQLGLSLTMWTAVRRGGKWLWLIALCFFLHFAVDSCAVVLSKSVGMVAVELVILALAIAVGAMGWQLARKLNS